MEGYLQSKIINHITMKRLIIASLLICLSVSISLACTGISLLGGENSWIQARTIEWGEFDLNSKIVVAPAGADYTTMLNDSTKGMSWRQKYGFVGISVSSDKFIGEGVNEAGLNAGVFYFRGYGSLEPLTKANRTRALTDMDFVRWMLGNFATVDEMLEAFKGITLVPVFLNPDGTPVPTGHWRVADKTGRNIVVEITQEGKNIKIHENNIGVLTNSPDFEWHKTNLSNYINLEPGTINSAEFGDYTANTFGTGTATLGLPGDITSPSRFVRAAFFVTTSPKSATTNDAVSLAFHILNNFDIPLGTEFSPDDRDKMPDLPSATQWTAVSDLSGARFFFKSMYNSTVRCIDLSKILSNKSEEHTMPLDKREFSFEEL